MIIHDSQRGAGFLLTDSARLLRKLIDRRLHPLGLSRAQWSILAILSNHEGLSQSQISLELEIEKREAETARLKGNATAGFGNHIRSYVLAPYQLVKDSRTGYEMGNAQAVLDGDISGFIAAYLKDQVNAG